MDAFARRYRALALLTISFLFVASGVDAFAAFTVFDRHRPDSQAIVWMLGALSVMIWSLAAFLYWTLIERRRVSANA